MKPYTSAYVFAPDAAGESVLAGELSLSGHGGLFLYADDWLSREDAYPLDPVNLPLAARPYVTRLRTEVHGVFLDAAPDSWGERVTLLKHKSLPRNVIEKLIRLSGTGVGGVQFSLSRTRPKAPQPLPTIASLDKLEEGAMAVDGRGDVPDDLLRLLAPGSSMGGARPKVTLLDESGHAWIAKFSRVDDLVDYPLVEFATMTLMAKAGINVPEVQIKKVAPDRHCYMIRRFDRVPGHGIHFISANALFNVDRIRSFGSAVDDPASYVALARILFKRASDPTTQAAQLFRRMVFNILVGNTDDHARNHAMLFDVATRTWALSPAYDVLPIVRGERQQSLAVGVMGRTGSIENAMSVCREFGLREAEAADIVDAVRDSLMNWRNHFADAGVRPTDRDLIGQVIDRNLAE